MYSNDLWSSSRVCECFACSCFENYTKNFKAILLLFKKSSFMKLMKFSLFNNNFFASIIIFCQYLLSTLKYDHLKKYSTILIFNFSQVIRLKIEPLLDVQRKQIKKNSRTKFQKIQLDCGTFPFFYKLFLSENWEFAVLYNLFNETRIPFVWKCIVRLVYIVSIWLTFSYLRAREKDKW